MRQIFYNEHKVYTEDVSYEEFLKRILFCGEESDSLVKYYDDITSSVLAEHFDLKKCPNKHIWFGEWENHRRMVVKLHYFYNHEVRFGYNYDFIPILNNQEKFVYHRTEKSVDLDVMDLYFNHIRYEEGEMTHRESHNIRRKYDLPEFYGIRDLAFAKDYIRKVIETNIPFMKDFYERYQTEEKIIDFLEHVIQNGNIFEKYNYIWTKAFLYAKLKDMDKAMKTMEEYYSALYNGKDIPQKVVEKLEAARNIE